MSKYYIGFDCGTQSTKTTIYDDNFDCVAEDMIPTEIYYPQAGWAEMDADKYYDSVIAGIKNCLAKSGIDPADVRAISGDGIICGIVGVDADGKAITPYIPYLDSRCAEDAAWVNANLEPLWIEESGNNSVDPFYPPMIARWFIKNNEAFKERGAKFINNGPYVLSRLANLKADDICIDWATLSGWLVGYDAIKKEWSKGQMAELEIPMEYLPKIVEPYHIIGTLSEDAAAATGLPAGIPIAAGAGDTMQSNVGCGLVKSGMAADVAGTAAMFTIMVDGINEDLTKNTDLLFSIGTLPDTYFYWGYIRTGGLSLRWFRDNVAMRPDDATFYDEIQALAEKIPAGSNGTIFIPYLTGGSGTLDGASGCFLNMTMNTTQPEMWRALLESIAYEYKGLTDTLKANGIPVDEVIITEGGSKSDLWNQIKADMLDAHVITMKRKEGAVMVDALLAAYAVGDIEDLGETVLKTLGVLGEYDPNPENTAVYEKCFEVNQELLKGGMYPVFQTLKKIQ